MLIIHARNISDSTKPIDVADYRVAVFVNSREIWTGFVNDHDRTKGAAILIRKIADAMEPSPAVIGPIDEEAQAQFRELMNESKQGEP